MKKKLLTMLCLLLLFFLIGVDEAKAANDLVYIVPIEGEVGPAMEQFVGESIQKAEDSQAMAIIFQINTPGGRVDSAVNISKAILDTHIPTIAYVDGEAISAGTIITISAQRVFMSSSSTIGAAETRPNEEKYISYWTGKLRNVAQQRGRDAKLIAAMADADIEIEGVVDKGKLLTLTAEEAINLEIIDGVENNLDGIMKREGLGALTLEKMAPSFQLKLASLATSVTASSILLSLGFIGIIIELISPGFGIGGVISLIAFGLYFGGVLLAGFSSWVIILLFIVGLILLLIEAFAPGFGVPGVLGVISIFTSIIMASSSIEQAIISLLISFLLTIVAAIVLFKFAPRNKFFDKISLSTSLDSSSGYIGSESFREYEGKSGIALTPLRPSGSILVEDRKLDAVSENAYIEKGTKIRIVKVEGRRIIVRKID